MQKISKTERIKGILEHERCQMIFDILMLMEKHRDLPLPNVYRLCKVIMEYYRKEGFRDQLRENGSKWNLSIFYISKHIKIIKQISRENFHPFDYHRSNDMLRGSWMFLTKKTYKEIAERLLIELNTRKDSYNNIIEDGNIKMKYNLQLPKIPEFTKIENKNEVLKITSKRQ